MENDFKQSQIKKVLFFTICYLVLAALFYWIVADDWSKTAHDTSHRGVLLWLAWLLLCTTAGIDGTTVVLYGLTIWLLIRLLILLLWILLLLILLLWILLLI